MLSDSDLHTDLASNQEKWVWATNLLGIDCVYRDRLFNDFLGREASVLGAAKIAAIFDGRECHVFLLSQKGIPMFARHELPRQVRLTDSRFEQPLSVDMQAFFEFSFDLAEDLLDLEAKYAPAPTGDCFDMAAKQAMWM